MLVCTELGLRPIMVLSVTDAHAESTVTVGASEGCQDEGDEASDRRGWLHHLMEAGAAVAAAEPLNPLQLGLIMPEPVLPEEIGLVALTAEPILPSEAGLVIPSIEPLLPEEVGLVVPIDGPALPSEVGLIVPHSLRFDEWADFSPMPRLPEEEELDFAASTHVRGNCSIGTGGLKVRITRARGACNAHRSRRKGDNGLDEDAARCRGRTDRWR